MVFFQPGLILAAETLPMAAYKTIDTSRTSTTTLTVDPDLTLAVVASSVYAVELVAGLESPAAADFQWDWSIPSGATLNNYAYSITLGNGGIATATTVGTMGTLGPPSAGVCDSITLRGTLVVGVTAGSITWRWAQLTSNASATSVRAGARLLLMRIG